MDHLCCISSNPLEHHSHPARNYPRLWLRIPLEDGPTGLSPARNMRRPAHTMAPSDSLPAAWHFPGALVIARPRSWPPQGQGRVGPLQFPRWPSSRSTPPTPGGPSAPAPGPEVLSMAFAKSTQARLLLALLSQESLTTLQASLHVADRSVALPRSRPGLSATPGGFATGGSWRLPGPDLHRLVIASLSLGYVMHTPLHS